MQHWLVERMRVWRVYSATPAAGHGWAGTPQQGWGSLATRCPKTDKSQIWRVGSKKSVMTWALWGVALVSCKVWHLVFWLAEYAGSISLLHNIMRRVVFYHWGGYMLTYIITDLPSLWSTSQTVYWMKCSQNLRQTHFLPSLKASVKQETHL